MNKYDKKKQKTNMLSKLMKKIIKSEQMHHENLSRFVKLIVCFRPIMHIGFLRDSPHYHWQ